MAFKSWQGSRSYRPADGDTLTAIAEREAAAGNPISAEDIARFNWGTEDPEEIQTLMRDELGARSRDGDRGYVLSGDDSARSELRIPEAFEQRGFSLEQTHQVRVTRKECPPQFLDCCSLPAITFDFDSSFVKPAVVDHLAAVETLVRSHPEAKLMVFGHTDAVGDEMYNKKLSERRAWAVYAFILNDPDAWETLYNHPDENWGLRVVQEILADLGHYQDAINGDMGPGTRSAMRAFLGLDESALVSNDAAFRRDLFAAYMGGKHDIEIDADRFMDPGFMGCGEFNLLEPTDSAEEKNRRVTVYAFNKDRLPNLPCAFADCGPCRNQMVTLENRHQEGFSCSFYDSWAKRCTCEGPDRPWIEVYLLDRAGHPIPNCPFRAHANGSLLHEGAADDSGIARLPPSTPGHIQIDFHRREAAGDPKFRFSTDYLLDVSSCESAESSRRMLHNLGYVFDEEHEHYVFDFQHHWSKPLTGEHSDIVDALGGWHSTGVPPSPGDHEDDPPDIEEGPRDPFDDGDGEDGEDDD